MKKLLIIGFVWPEPNSTAAGTRMLQLIKLFIKEGYSITFVCSAAKTDKSYHLEKLNIQTFEIEINNPSFDTLLASLNPDITLFDRYLTEEQFGWRVTENCPNSLKILDTEDLHFLRNARQTAHKTNTKVSLNLLMNETAKREIASIYRCDLTLLISKFELKLLKSTFKINKTLLQYVPFLLDHITLNSLQNYTSFSNRKHFMTMGNFRHYPNWNSVLYLKSTIWPLIKQKLPTAEIHIYGAYATKKITQLNNPKEGFMIKGWAENTENTYTKARVCLAPIQFGAGLKGKLVDAMKFGTPSVTTSIGAEAMHKNLPWNGFICNSPEEIALKAVELYKNETIWNKAQQNGVEIINKCFSKEKYEKKLWSKIVTIQKRLANHRLQNFIGSMLKHHTLRSTKYMSKWIEEKNNTFIQSQNIELINRNEIKLTKNKSFVSLEYKVKKQVTMIVKSNNSKHREFKGIKFELLSTGEKSMVTKMIYNIGDKVPIHSHPNEQSGYVISGEYIIIIGEIKEILKQGDSYSIPENVEHSLEVIIAGNIIDVFSPPRKDYL